MVDVRKLRRKNLDMYLPVRLKFTIELITFFSLSITCSLEN